MIVLLVFSLIVIFSGNLYFLGFSVIFIYAQLFGAFGFKNKKAYISGIFWAFILYQAQSSCRSFKEETFNGIAQNIFSKWDTGFITNKIPNVMKFFDYGEDTTNQNLKSLLVKKDKEFLSVIRLIVNNIKFEPAEYQSGLLKINLKTEDFNTLQKYSEQPDVINMDFQNATSILEKAIQKTSVEIEELLAKIIRLIITNISVDYDEYDYSAKAKLNIDLKVEDYHFFKYLKHMEQPIKNTKITSLFEDAIQRLFIGKEKQLTKILHLIFANAFETIFLQNEQQLTKVARSVMERVNFKNETEFYNGIFEIKLKAADYKLLQKFLGSDIVDYEKIGSILADSIQKLVLNNDNKETKSILGSLIILAAAFCLFVALVTKNIRFTENKKLKIFNLTVIFEVGQQPEERNQQVGENSEARNQSDDGNSGLILRETSGNTSAYEEATDHPNENGHIILSSNNYPLLNLAL